MSKKPANHGNAWSAADDKQLRQLAAQNTPTRVAGSSSGARPKLCSSTRE